MLWLNSILWFNHYIETVQAQKTKICHESRVVNITEQTLENEDVSKIINASKNNVSGRAFNNFTHFDVVFYQNPPDEVPPGGALTRIEALLGLFRAGESIG